MATTLFPSILPSDDADPGEQIDAGVCPWCSWEGTSVPQHASSAHPDAWTAYREGE